MINLKEISSSSKKRFYYVDAADILTDEYVDVSIGELKIINYYNVNDNLYLGSIKYSYETSKDGVATLTSEDVVLEEFDKFPTIEVTPSYSVDLRQVISWTDTGASEYKIRINGGDWISTGTVASYTPTADLINGSNIIEIKSKSSYSHWSFVDSFKLKVKSVLTAPTITMAETSNNNKPVFTVVGAGTYFRVNFNNRKNWIYIPSNTYSQVLTDGRTTLYAQQSEDGTNWSNSGNLTVNITEKEAVVVVIASPVIVQLADTSDITPTVTWGAVAEADSYEVSIDGTNYTDIGNVLEYTYAEQTVGACTIKVRTVIGTNKSEASTMTFNRLTSTPTPTITQLADSPDRTPTVTWDAIANVTSYEVSIDDGITWTSTGTTASYTYATLTPGAYTIKVRATVSIDLSDVASMTFNAIEVAPIIKYSFTDATNPLKNKGTGTDIYDITNVNSATLDLVNGLNINGVDQYGDVNTDIVVDSTDFYIKVIFKSIGTTPDSDYGADMIVGGCELYTRPSGIGIGQRADKAFAMIQSQPINTDVVINDGAEHIIEVYYSTKLSEFRMKVDGVLKGDVPLWGEYYHEFTIKNFYLGRSVIGERYFNGSIKYFEFRIEDLPATCEFSSRITALGSSLTLGQASATGAKGYIYELSKIPSLQIDNRGLINTAIGGTTTTQWSEAGGVFDTTMAKLKSLEDVWIGFELGNEYINSGDYSTYKSGLEALIVKVLAESGSHDIFLSSCTVRVGQNAQYYIDTKLSIPYLESLPNAYYVADMVGVLDDKTGEFLTYSAFENIAHPNASGYHNMYLCISPEVADKTVSYDISTVQSTVSNTTKWFNKVDNLTPNAMVIQSENPIGLFTLTTEVKSTSSLVSKTLLSAKCTNLDFRLNVDASGNLELFDSVGGTSQSVTTLANLATAKTLSVVFHQHRDVDLFVDGVLSNTISFLGSEKNLSGTFKLCLGGLVDAVDGTGDIDNISFRNVVLHRSPLTQTAITNHVAGTIQKASQEFLLECDSLADKINKAQTNTTITINDPNII